MNISHIRITVITFVALTVGLSVVLHSRGPSSPGIKYLHTPGVEKLGNDLAANNMMPRPEYDQLEIIKGNVAAGMKPSSDDLENTIRIYEKHRGSFLEDIVPRQEAISTMVVMSSGLQTAKIRRDTYWKFYSTSLSFISVHDPMVPAEGATILGNLGDRRAISSLLPYQDDANPNMRRSTRWALRRLGLDVSQLQK